ncbi:MAG: hypothetical protein LC723_12265 [Actinobacteria bacterium]|nr:hypothetical protein [Actinomycetota bacterium]
MAKTSDIARSMSHAPMPVRPITAPPEAETSHVDTTPAEAPQTEDKADAIQVDPLVFGPYGRPTFAPSKANPFEDKATGVVTSTLARATFPILGIPGLVFVALVKRKTSKAVVAGNEVMNVETYVQMANFGRGTGFAQGLEAVSPSAQSAMDNWLYLVSEAAENWYETNNSGAVMTGTSDRKKVTRMIDPKTGQVIRTAPAA